jgi:ubiquinone/menaquinone biosynthesis C-methylase UbiE
MTIEFTNPRTGSPLREENQALVDTQTGEVVAPVRNGLPRFVTEQGTYADNFGYQWNLWEHTLSDARSGIDHKRNLILDRTKFDRFDTQGKTILECGMGGGDDTEILLSLPFSEVYSFDYSNSVDRAAKYLADPRLRVFQASIFEIPFPDQAFDFVFCHRVLQHTPDPEAALRAICRKVKPGGVLFVHSYNRTLINLMAYKYKYRWLTKRLPHETVKSFLDRFGPLLHRTNEGLSRLGKPGRFISYSFVPFESFGPTSEWRRMIDKDAMYELCKLITFDALTPRYDKPMRWRTMERILIEEGFSVRHAHTSPLTAIWCTSVRNAA